MFLTVFSSLVCWIDLLLQMVKCYFSVVTLLYLVTEFCLEVSEVEHVVTRRYSSQRQLRLGLVLWLVSPLGRKQLSRKTALRILAQLGTNVQ